MSAADALIKGKAVLSARLVSGELHVVAESGAKERWKTKQLSSGGNNTVLEIVGQGLVARFSTEPMGPDEQRKYVDEIEAQTALGEGPRAACRHRKPRRSPLLFTVSLAQVQVRQ